MALPHWGVFNSFGVGEARPAVSLFVKEFRPSTGVSILTLERRIQRCQFGSLRLGEPRVEFETPQFSSALPRAIPVLPNHVAPARAGLKALQARLKAPNTHGCFSF